MVVTETGAGRSQLVVPADVERLSEVRGFVREVVGELGGSNRDAEDLVQAVDEATCNVMLHGYGGKPGEIEVEAAWRDHRIEIRILDRAPVRCASWRPVAASRSALRMSRSGGTNSQPNTSV